MRASVRLTPVILVAAAALLFGATGASAFSGGVSGKSGKAPAAKCSGCHSAGGTQPPMSVVVTGPKQPQAGTLGVYTVVVSGLVAGVAFDIAASSGALEVVDKVVPMQLLGGELTHTSSWPHGTTSVSFDIGWTAPPDLGPATLFLGILNVNGDTSTDGDAEAYSTFTVDVQAPPDLAGADLSGLDFATVTIDAGAPADANTVTKTPMDEARWSCGCALGGRQGPPGPTSLLFSASFVGLLGARLHRRRRRR